MSLSYGTSITRNGLAVHFDLDNAKSWKGKPTTNLSSQNLHIYNGLTGTYLGLENGWKKYSISGTWSLGSYPYSMTIGNTTHTGGTAYSARLLIKTNVRHKFNAWGGINYTNDPNMQSSGISVVTSLGYDVDGYEIQEWKREGYIYSTGYNGGSASNPGYLVTRPAGNGTTFDPSTDFVWVKEIQVEQGSFPTKYVNGQRLDTASIIDISKRNTITPYNLTYQQGVGPQFDGVDGLLHINGNNVSASPSAHSVEMWCNVNTGGGIYSSYNGDTNRVRLSTNGSSFSVFSGHSSNGPLIFNTPNVMLSGQWNHIVVTLDYNNNDHKIYVNGQLEATGNTDLNPPNAFGHVTVGCHLDYDVPAPSYYNFYDGEVGQFRLYDGILTQENITNNFEASRGRYKV